MSSRGRKEAISSAKTIYYHSAIGTHRLQPRPLKNILYPYYRQYKPVYRARNPRTPSYYWPSIDKYPWHSHQKRFPKAEDIGIELFSQFCHRDPKVRTLFETLHPLALHGVNCLVWKRQRTRESSDVAADQHRVDGATPDAASDDRYQIVKILDNYYVIDKVIKNDSCYLIKKVEYKLRPFKARIVSDLYMNGRLIRENVSPVGSVRGEWSCSVPYRVRSTAEADGVTLDMLCVEDNTLYTPGFIEFQRDDATH